MNPPPIPSAGIIDEQSNALLAAARWIEALLLGPLATSVAVIAVALVGFLMLSGRINLRRGATVIVGCFILFGAASIAHGIRGSSVTGSGGVVVVRSVPAHVNVPAELLMSTPTTSEPIDPYAGAAIRP